jgi:phosphatidylglycerol lysyltransferase
MSQTDGRPCWRLPAQLAIVAAAAILALLGFEALVRIAHELKPSALKHALGEIGHWRIVMAVILTAISYLALSSYDRFAFEAMGRRLAWRRTAYVAFSSYAISNSLGFHLITGGSTRYMLYSRADVPPSVIVRVALLGSGAFWSALLLLTGAVLAFGPTTGDAILPRLTGIPQPAVGVAIIVLLVVAWGCFLGVRKLRARLIGDDAIRLPALCRLVGAALVDVLSAAGALFVLTGVGPTRIVPMIVAYVVAVVGGIASHVPAALACSRRSS